MAGYLQELYKLSESGNKDAQIILVFKLIYEFDRDGEAYQLCSKWLGISPLFKAILNFMGVMYQKPNDPDYINNRTLAFDIFKSLSIAEDDTVEVHYAWYMLGRYYRHGYIVGKNITESLRWYEKSANKGNEFANFDLGDHYLSFGQYDDAIVSYENAVKCYNTKAISKLIAMDQNGVRLKNPFHIYRWLLQSGPNNKLQVHVDLMRRIIFNNNIEWTIDNHVCWRDLNCETVLTGLVNARKLRVIRFEEQVKILLLISKCRQSSHLPYLGILNKVIVVGIVKKLADLWCDM